MLYQQEFGPEFRLGLQLDQYPFLTDKSWHSDVCPSFYFSHEGLFFVLWIDFSEPENRENETARYLIMTAENEGDASRPELSCNNGEVVFETNSAKALDTFFMNKGQK